MTTRHCRDPHCANFATGDSDWCKKHRAEQIETGLLAVEDQTAFGMRHIEERYGDPDRAWLGGVEIQPTGEFRNLGNPTQAGRDASEEFVSGFIGVERVRPIETDYNIPRDTDPHGVFDEISQEAGYRHFDAAEPVLTDEQRRRLAEMTPAEKFAVVQSAVDGAKRGRRKHRAPTTTRRSWRRMFRKATP